MAPVISAALASSSAPHPPSTIGAGSSRACSIPIEDKNQLAGSHSAAVWILMAMGALARIASFHFSSNTGGDALARLGLLAEWLRHPTFKIVFEDYPPGHFWLMGLFTIIFRDVTFAGRFLSLVLGIGSLYFLWRLTRSLYGSYSALFALAVFSAYTVHIAYSTTSSAEVPYLFFAIAGMACFFEYFRDVSRPMYWLALCGTSFSIAESIRLEAWIIFFTLGVAFLLLRFQESRTSSSSGFRDWITPSFVLGITGSAWPLFSIIYSFLLYHDPMRVLSRHNAAVTGWFRSHPVSLAYQLGLFPAALLISLCPLAFAAAAYGFVRSWKDRLSATFATTVLLLAFVQIFEIATGKLLAMSRYTLTLGTTAAVLSGYGCMLLLSGCSERLKGAAFAAMIFALILNASAVLFLSARPNRFSAKMASLSPVLRYPAPVAGVGHFLRGRLGPQDAVVIDDYNVESNVIANASGLPLLPGKRVFLASKKNDISVNEYIQQERPRFLVYSDEGTLKSSIPLASGCGTQGFQDITYECEFANATYKVYKLEYLPH